MLRRLPGALALAMIVSCGPDKQPPIDLSALPGPDASAFSSESDLRARMGSEIDPLWASGVEGSFTGVAGVTVRYHVQRVEGEKGAVVLCPGRTTPARAASSWALA